MLLLQGVATVILIRGDGFVVVARCCSEAFRRGMLFLGNWSLGKGGVKGVAGLDEDACCESVGGNEGFCVVVLLLLPIRLMI